MTLFGCYCEAYPDLTIQTWVLLQAPSTNHFAISHLRRSIRFDRVAPEALVFFLVQFGILVLSGQSYSINNDPQYSDKTQINLV